LGSSRLDHSNYAAEELRVFLDILIPPAKVKKKIVFCKKPSRSKLGTGKGKKPLKRLECSPFREFVMFPVSA